MLNYFRKSISSKIIGIFSIFILLLTTVIMFYLPSAQEKQIRKSLDRYIVAVAEILSFTSGSAMEELNMKALDEIFNWAKQDKSIRYLAIIEKEGNILASYNPDKLEKDYKSLLRNREIFEDRENTLLFTSTEIKYQEEILGNILLGYSLDETKGEISHIRGVSLLFIIPLGLIALALIFIIITTVTKPLKELNRAANLIAGEMAEISIKVKTEQLETGIVTSNLNSHKTSFLKRDSQVNVNTDDEVGNLAKTFNTMAHNIFKTTKELNKKNEELANAFKQLKDIQQQLIEKEKLASLAGLTAGIAHELRNPLNFVNNFSEVNVELTEELREEAENLKDKIEEDNYGDIEDIINTLEKNSRKINEHGKRAESIIKTMLQHSRGKTGEVQPTKLNDFIKEYVSLAYHGVRAKDTSIIVNFDTDYDDMIGEINIIPQDFSRVILNLVNNACYATNQRRKELGEGFIPFIYIKTQNFSDIVEIRVKDNGKGISEEIIGKIFNPFFTTKPTGEGTGLGLSMSYDIIVQQHRGKIRVESKPDQYTEFIITIPKDLKAGVIV